MPPPPGYNFDVFISFPGEQPQATWMRRLFEPAFRGALSNAYPYYDKDRVFFMNTETQPGTPLALALGVALKTSCVLIPALSYPYFRRPWCAAEWMSFRTPSLNAGNVHGRQRNIAPFIYAGDPAQYPTNAQHAGGLVYRDFTPFNALRTTTQKFLKNVDILAQSVARMLAQQTEGPDPNWPAYTAAQLDVMKNVDPAQAAQWMFVNPPVISKPVMSAA